MNDWAETIINDLMEMVLRWLALFVWIMAGMAVIALAVVVIALVVMSR